MTHSVWPFGALSFKLDLQTNNRESLFYRVTPPTLDVVFFLSLMTWGKAEGRQAKESKGVPHASMAAAMLGSGEFPVPSAPSADQPTRGI